MKKKGLFWDEDASRLEEETGLQWNVAYVEVSRDCSKIKKHIYCWDTKECKEIVCDNKWHRCKLAFPKKCPKCGHELVFVERYGKENRKDDFNWNKSGTWRFLGCSNYPNCTYIKKEKRIERPKCEGRDWGEGIEFDEYGNMWMDASEFF